MKKVFFDTEFTGSRKSACLISIGFVSEENEQFYAVLTDYDPSDIDDWLRKNVIENLASQSANIIGTKAEVASAIRAWMEKTSDGEKIQMVSDVLAFDWVLFCDLFGSAFDIPECVHYIPMDLGTKFAINGLDPDTNRIDFAEERNPSLANLAKLKLKKHNALYDAIIIKECWESLKL